MSGDELKYIRERLGRSIDHVSVEWFGITPRKLSRMEKGLVPIPPYIEVDMLNRAFRASLVPFAEAHTEPEVTAEHLKAFRKKYNLTLSEAAGYTLFTPAAWHGWESGKTAKIPPFVLYVLRDIARRLNNAS